MTARALRPVRIVGDDAFVTLTQGFEAVIDAQDAALVEAWNWAAQVRETAVYAFRKPRENGAQRMTYLHRVLMGEPKGLVVDHIDGDTLNNRRSNLRVATHAENGRNSRRSRANTSGFKGVWWHRRGSKWRAGICVAGKKIFLGGFSTPEEAHAAYVAAATVLHGEFANSGKGD